MPQFVLPAVNSLTIGIIAIIAGIIIIAFPRILNYVIGIFMVVVGIIWIIGGGWLPGVISIVVGIVVLLFPHILNYLVGIYLILLGLWFIFASSSLIIGIITLIIGIVVMIFPDSSELHIRHLRDNNWCHSDSPLLWFVIKDGAHIFHENHSDYNKKCKIYLEGG